MKPAHRPRPERRQTRPLHPGPRHCACSVTAAAVLLLGLCNVAAHATPLDPAGALQQHVIEGEMAGPVVVIVSGIHGDEPSGPDAARILAREFRPARGRLIIIPEAAPEALAEDTRWASGWSDLNRAFDRPPDEVTGTAEANAAETVTAARAAELLAYILAARPDLVLDLHESDATWTESGGPSIVLPPSGRGADMVLALLETASLADFGFTGSPPRGSLARALDRRQITALIVEVPDALSYQQRVDAHLRLLHEVLNHLQMAAESAR